MSPAPKVEGALRSAPTKDGRRKMDREGESLQEKTSIEIERRTADPVWRDLSTCPKNPRQNPREKGTPRMSEPISAAARQTLRAHLMKVIEFERRQVEWYDAMKPFMHHRLKEEAEKRIANLERILAEESAR